MIYIILNMDNAEKKELITVWDTMTLSIVFQRQLSNNSEIHIFKTERNCMRKKISVAEKNFPEEISFKRLKIC